MRGKVKREQFENTAFKLQQEGKQFYTCLQKFCLCNADIIGYRILCTAEFPSFPQTISSPARSQAVKLGEHRHLWPRFSLKMNVGFFRWMGSVEPGGAKTFTGSVALPVMPEVPELRLMTKRRNGFLC